MNRSHGNKEFDLTKIDEFDQSLKGLRIQCLEYRLGLVSKFKDFADENNKFVALKTLNFFIDNLGLELEVYDFDKVVDIYKSVLYGQNLNSGEFKDCTNEKKLAIIMAMHANGFKVNKNNFEKWATDNELSESLKAAAFMSFFPGEASVKENEFTPEDILKSEESLKTKKDNFSNLALFYKTERNMNIIFMPVRINLLIDQYSDKYNLEQKSVLFCEIKGCMNEYIDVLLPDEEKKMLSKKEKQKLDGLKNKIDKADDVNKLKPLLDSKYENNIYNITKNIMTTCVDALAEKLENLIDNDQNKSKEFSDYFSGNTNKIPDFIKLDYQLSLFVMNSRNLLIQEKTEEAEKNDRFWEPIGKAWAGVGTAWGILFLAALAVGSGLGTASTFSGVAFVAVIVAGAPFLGVATGVLAAISAGALVVWCLGKAIRSAWKSMFPGSKEVKEAIRFSKQTKKIINESRKSDKNLNENIKKLENDFYSLNQKIEGSKFITGGDKNKLYEFVGLPALDDDIKNLKSTNLINNNIDVTGVSEQKMSTSNQINESFNKGSLDVKDIESEENKNDFSNNKVNNIKSATDKKIEGTNQKNEYQNINENSTISTGINSSNSPLKRVKVEEIFSTGIKRTKTVIETNKNKKTERGM